MLKQSIRQYKSFFLCWDVCCVCALEVQGASGWKNPAGGKRAGDEFGERGDGGRGPEETGERTRAGEAERRQREVTHTLTDELLQHLSSHCMHVASNALRQQNYCFYRKYGEILFECRCKIGTQRTLFCS